MRTLNHALFQWIAAGYDPNPWVLPLASAIALGGAWVIVGLMGLARSRKLPLEWRPRHERSIRSMNG